MSANKSQIVVYHPNETVRLDVRLQKCCQCENVASCQSQFPMKWGGMMEQLETGNILTAVALAKVVGIGNT